jgi:hypothetical protein
LYFLKGLSDEDRYGQAADAELKWLLHNGQLPNMGLLLWSKHLSWDVMADTVACDADESRHESLRPWMLWDRCFELAPEQSKRFATDLFVEGNESQAAKTEPRQAGFLIRTAAEAFAHTKDDLFLGAIETVFARFEKDHSFAAGLPNASDALSLAIDCDGAARKVPEPLRTRLTAFAAREDARFCALPHTLKEEKGFVKSLDAHGPGISYTSMWDPRHGPQTAAVGVMCVSRYQNTGKIGYRELIVAAADAYLHSLPAEEIDAWPLTFGQVITLELAAWRITAKRKYHARAFKLGELAVNEFFGESPLPRASLKTNHYESTTGADTLALALAELHLSTRTITAVRTPANTIDR